MDAIRGRVVITRGEPKPYKVVLEHETGISEYPVSTIAEGEAFIRQRTTCRLAESVITPEWHI